MNSSHHPRPSVLAGKVILFLILLTSAADAISIGAAPSTLRFEKMVRGGYAEREISVGTSGDDNLSITVDVTGSIKNWITIQPTKEFTLPSKSSQKLKAVVKSPSDAGNGVYEADIVITAAPVKSVGEGTGMAVGGGVILKVIVDITDIETSTYNVLESSVSDTEVGYPVEFQITVQNTGNVKNRPKLFIDIYDGAGATLLKTVNYSGIEILPSKTETITVDCPTDGLEAGKFNAKIRSLMLYKNTSINKVYERFVDHDTLAFEIFKEGMLSVKGELMSLVSDKEKASVGDTVKITALFRNTGDYRLTAVLEGEVLSGLNLDRNFESKEYEVNPNETKTIFAYYTPTKSGKYTVKGWVTYGKKQTEPKEFPLKVGGEQDIYLYAVIILVILVAGYVYFKKKT